MTVILAVSGVAQAEIVRRAQGGVLTNSPGYDWWYGCSPTSAGMIMAYYDRNGYGGLAAQNIYNQHILDWDSHMPLIYIIRRCP